MSIPEDLKYTKDHEWLRIEGDVATVGVTHHAQEELSDVVYVEIPEVGTNADEGEGVAVVESVKAASDIYAPLAGEIVEANEDLDGDPALINTDPYGKGWIYKLKLADASAVSGLLDAAGYTDHVS